MKLEVGKRYVQRLEDDPKGTYDIRVTITGVLESGDFYGLMHADVDRKAQFRPDGARIENFSGKEWLFGILD